MLRALCPPCRLCRRPPCRGLTAGPAPPEPPRRPEPPDPPRLPLWQRAAVAGAVAGAVGAGWLYLGREKERRRRQRRLRELQELALGRGDFELQDTSGTPQRRADLLGRWVLLYFGFTHCPDVCPEQLERLCRAVTLLEADPALPPVQPLFITVDPERDDPAALGRYLGEFHPRLRGLTGSAEHVRAAARAFRVYVSQGTPDTDGDYVVDHSVLTFLLGPDGLVRDCYGQSRTAEELARSVRRHMETYEPLPPG